MKDFFVKKERQSNSKILLYTLSILIMLFIGVQLYVLTTVGMQSEKLSRIREEQTRLRIENEIKQAEVLKLQSRKNILESIDNLGMKEAEVVMINSEDRTANSLTQ